MGGHVAEIYALFSIPAYAAVELLSVTVTHFFINSRKQRRSEGIFFPRRDFFLGRAPLARTSNLSAAEYVLIGGKKEILRNGKRSGNDSYLAKQRVTFSVPFRDPVRKYRQYREEYPFRSLNLSRGFCWNISE